MIFQHRTDVVCPGCEMTLGHYEDGPPRKVFLTCINENCTEFFKLYEFPVVELLPAAFQFSSREIAAIRTAKKEGL